MSKYHNVKTEVGGITFDSKREAARWQELLLMQQAGVIGDLKRQVVYWLQPAFRDNTGAYQASIRYVADFVYVEDGKTVVEDVKGVVTQTFALKAKLFKFKYPDIDFRLVR